MCKKICLGEFWCGISQGVSNAPMKFITYFAYLSLFAVDFIIPANKEHTTEYGS